MSARNICYRFMDLLCIFIFRLFLVQLFETSSMAGPEFGVTYQMTVNDGFGFSKNVTLSVSRHSWVHVYVRMCGKFCNGNLEVSMEVYGPYPPFCRDACYTCDCDVDCVLYGTCCPHVDPSTPLGQDDMEERYGEDSFRFVGNLSNFKFKDTNDFLEYSRRNPGREMDKKLNGRFQCLPVAFEADTTNNVFGIGDCPESETNLTLRFLCENDDPDPVTVEKLLPISDSRTGVMYKNVYCLKCWQQHEEGTKQSQSSSDNFGFLHDYHLKWNMTIKCYVYQGLYRITDLNEFLSSVLKTMSVSSKNPFCTLAYTLDAAKNDSRLTPKPCQEYDMQSPPPNCDGSTNNDEMTSTLCATVRKPAYSVSGGHSIFCHLCTNKNPNCLSHSRQGLVTIVTPLNFLLGHQSAVVFDEEETFRDYQTYSCPQPLYWMHKHEGCILPSCVEGKILDVNSGQCKTAISVIGNLGYKLSMVLVPDRNIPTLYSFRIQDQINDLYSELMESGYLAVYMIIFGAEQSEEFDVIKYVKVQGHFVAKKGIKRDEFETKFLNYKFKMLMNPFDHNSTVTLTLGGMGVDHVDRMELREYTLGNPEEQYHLPSIKDEYVEVGVMADQPPVDLIWIPPSTEIRDSPSPVILKETLSVNVGSSKHKDPIWKMKSEFIDMVPTLLCPFVELDLKDVGYINETKLHITFYYNDQEKTINTTTHDRVVTIEGRKVKICIDTFREEFQKVTIRQSISNNTEFKISWMEAFKRHLTICCLSLSVVCLLVTSITYCIFAQLRTLPGLNTLCLCLTLACAQLTLILVVELVGFVDGYICIGLGIALHYFWLCSFCWMGVACVHMYLVFRGSNTRRTTNKSPADLQAQYRILAFGTSAVIVSVHICVCEIVSEGDTTGYSDVFCFFDTPWSVWTVVVSFVVPLAVLLIVNAVLFGKTVREMVAVRRLQAVRRIKTRDELLTYVKLSTMTGVQWFVSLIALAFQSHAIDIAVAILVGLQGVFIFMSFTLNRTTRNLYSNLCSGDGQPSEGTSQTTSQASKSQTVMTQATDV